MVIQLETSLKNSLREAILDYGAIRYIRISAKIKFFLIKVPGIHLEDSQSLSFEPGEGFQNDGMLCNVSNEVPRYGCVIFDGNKLYYRGKDKIVEAILWKYHNQIFIAPEFSLTTHFIPQTKQMKITDVKGWENSGYGEETFTEFDYLMPRKEVKTHSPDYFRHVTDLLRKIGFLKEMRGKSKPVNSVVKTLKKVVIKEYKSLPVKKDKRLPIKKLREELERKADKLTGENEEEAKKYYRHDSTIRRWIASIKK